MPLRTWAPAWLGAGKFPTMVDLGELSMVAPPTQNLGSLLHRAANALGAGKLDHAERLARQVLGRAPRNSQAIHLLGIVQAKTGRQREAVTQFEAAAALDPRNPEIQKNLGFTYY